MANRILAAIAVGIGTGVIIIISNMLLAVIGFFGGFAIPFLGIATSLTAWILTAVFLIGGGWLVASYTWSADRKSAIRICVGTGIVAGIISQTVNLLIGFGFSLLFGAIGAAAGYLAGGNNAAGMALLGAIGGLLLGAAISFVQFLLWVTLSILFCAIGGYLYSSKAGKQRTLTVENTFAAEK